MNNEEKREYISLQKAYDSIPFMSELMQKEDFFKKTPKTLYKFRKFDKYTVDMIENDYVYLTPARKLDDPFDCLTNIDFASIVKKHKGKYSLSSEMFEYVAEVVYSHPSSKELTKEGFLNMFKDCIENGTFNFDRAREILKTTEKLTYEQKFLLNLIIDFILDNYKNKDDKDDLKKFIKDMLESKKTVGICSFTTNLDNKPMWSLYANIYRGYCIEYKTPKRKNFINSLSPVIYSKDTENDIFKTIIKFNIESLIRNISDGKMKTNIGCATELLCTKDTDWESQSEWRLIGNAGYKETSMEIKNIYLGFKVSKKNESVIVDLARKKKFGVYKMNKPTGSKTITYIRLI